MLGEHCACRGSLLFPPLRPLGVSLVSEAGSEEGEARELPASPVLLSGFSAALQVRRVLGPLSSRHPARGLREGRGEGEPSRAAPEPGSLQESCVLGWGFPSRPAPLAAENLRDKGRLPSLGRALAGGFGRLFSFITPSPAIKSP